MNKNAAIISNSQLPKESILEEIRKNAYNTAPSHNVALALDSDMKRIANRIDKWEDFVKEVADIFFKNSPFGMIRTHQYCFNKEYNSDQNVLINAVFCFLANSYGNCSEDNYHRLIKSPELALQNSEDNISHYKYLSILRDGCDNRDNCRKFDISIKQYNLLSKTIDTLSPVGYYHIKEQRLELDFHLSKLYVDVYDINKILNSLKDLSIG